MRSMRWLIFLAACVFTMTANAADDPKSAATATNQFGVDLYRQIARENGNICLSPYSIESALAMTSAGADGETETEMRRVLHLSGAATNANGSFAALQKSLAAMASESARSIPRDKASGGPLEPITLSIANRLFAQSDYDFRESFLALMKSDYGAPVDLVDFKKDASGVSGRINDWVAEQTRKRIRNLIPPNALDATTRMVLINALYLKAPWADPFEKESTRPQPFHLVDGKTIDVPMMQKQSRAFGYAKKADFTAVSVPYAGDDLRFVLLLPNESGNLAKLEAKLDGKLLDECAQLPSAYVDLSSPKFSMEPPTISLQSELEALGMKTAFDDPSGSANFDRLAPRRPNDYLFISKVFHKTFISVDETGTEAAAATAVVMALATSAMHPEQPIEVRVDRPFLYFIQQPSTGVCLFLGRVTDPR